MSFLLLHSPCPTGWKSEPARSVELVRLAVDSGLFPLYEIFGGRRYRINVAPTWTDPGEYYELQGRFRPDEVDVETTQRACHERFERLRALAELYPA